MLNKTAEYALRAIVYLARHPDEWPLPGTRIASATRIPAKYLSKIMGDLVRGGVLQATRGVGGGFRLARPADRTTLNEVLAPFEPVETDGRTCPFSSGRCSDRNPCFGHEGWKMVLQTYEHFLATTTIHQVAFGAVSQ